MSANWVRLQPLRYFVTVADEGNLTRASEHLHLTQPALSRQLLTLEENLGVRLFDRLPRGVRLTTAGERLLPHARAVLGQIQVMVDEMDRLTRGKKGALRIGLSPVAMDLPSMRTILDSHRQSDPAVDLLLEVHTSQAQIGLLRAGEQDIGFLFSEEPHDPLLNLELVEEHQLGLGMSVRHPLNALPRLTFDDLAPYDFVGRFMSTALDQALHQANFRPRTVQQITDTKLMLQVLASGHGLAFVNSAWAKGPVDGIVVRTVEGLNVPLPIYLSWRTDETRSIVLEFAKHALAIISRSIPLT